MALYPTALRIVTVAGASLPRICGSTFYRGYALKKSMTAAKITKLGAQASQKKQPLEVETDPERLLSHCCGANIYAEGTDPELKPDSEYPEWLWNLSVDRNPPSLSELDPNDSYYWQRVNRIVKLRETRIRKRLDKIKHIQSPLTETK